jgi:hypothetical protein
MAEQLSTPRVSARYLDSFTGKLVMIWGKVTQLRGDQASIDSDGVVNVLLNRVRFSARKPMLCHARASITKLYGSLHKYCSKLLLPAWITIYLVFVLQC